MTSDILNALKRDYSEFSLAPYADGRFEVFVDDDLLYSKLKTGEFPDNATIVKKIEKRR